MQEFTRTNAGEPTSESRYRYDDASTGGDSDGNGDFDPERLAGGSYRFKFDGNDGDAPGPDWFPGNNERSGIFGGMIRDNGYRLVPSDSNRIQVNDDYDQGSLSFDSSDPVVANGSNDTFAIHPGGRKGEDGAPDDPDNVVSAGCLTVHPDDWWRFDASLPLDEFSLVLVNEQDLNLPP